jgi:hypothetical protein
MLDASDDLLAVLRGSYVTRLHVNSWRGDELLHDDVPVATGSLSLDRSLAVPERLTFTVPRLADGVDWAPRAIDHPLAAYGQLLQVGLGVYVGDVEEILRLGWYLITDTTTEDDTVDVTAEGMLKLLDEARFVAPFEPSGTFTDTVQALVEPALTVVFEGLTDRSVPLGMKWDEDRLGALHEVIDAWPAEAYVTEDGYLRVTDVPTPETDVAVWDVTADPVAGTVVKWSGATTREGAYNIVVARGEDTSNEQVQAVEFDEDQTSGTYYGSPFNPLPVPYFFYSPLLTTVAQCEKAAKSIVRRKRRARSKRVSIEMVPNPALRLSDVVTVTNDELDGARGTVEGITLPLTPGGGNMALAVSLTSPEG